MWLFAVRPSFTVATHFDLNQKKFLAKVIKKKIEQLGTLCNELHLLHIVEPGP